MENSPLKKEQIYGFSMNNKKQLNGLLKHKIARRMPHVNAGCTLKF